MNDSILNSVKKTLGITYEYTHFDTDIIMHINSVFNILTQLGAGPAEGYRIEDGDNMWSEFTDDNVLLELCKSYVCAKVRMMFDPPTTSSISESMNRIIGELEWRINITVDHGKSGV